MVNEEQVGPMKRTKKMVVVGIVIAVLLTLFFLAPVIGFSEPACVANLPPGYESLSFHFFNVGEVYYAGGFSWFANGFPVQSCV